MTSRLSFVPYSSLILWFCGLVHICTYTLHLLPYMSRTRILCELLSLLHHHLLTLSHSLSLSLFLSLCPSLCHSLSVSLSLSLCISLPFSPSLSPFYQLRSTIKAIVSDLRTTNPNLVTDLRRKAKEKHGPEHPVGVINGRGLYNMGGCGINCAGVACRIF